MDSSGRTVALRGFNAGGSLEVEPWMSAVQQNPPPGFPQVLDEITLWEVLTYRFGNTSMLQLQQTWRNAWFNPNDIPRLAAMGVTAIRIPFFYQLLQSDSNPGVLNPTGTAILDSWLDACAQYGIYAILDMHGAPGGQSDIYTTGQDGLNQLFKSKADQDQTVQLWGLIAARYANRPEVAGYDLLNEPFGAPDAPTLLAFYNRIYQAIRAVDSRHIMFMEDAAMGTIAMPAPSSMNWQNVAYSIHVYLPDLASNQQYLSTTLPYYNQYLTGINTPLYVGEINTITAAQGGVPVMTQYFSAFQTYGWAWTVWNYKYVDAVNGTNNIIGLFTNPSPWNGPDPYNDSLSTLQTKFAAYDTSNLQVQPAMLAAIQAATPPGPRITAIANGASFAPAISAGSWVSVLGGKLSATTRPWGTPDFVGNQLPVALDGVSATINGKTAYPSYISPGQLNILAPDDATTGPVTVEVQTALGNYSFLAQKNLFAPAFFLATPQYPSAVHADGSYVGKAGLIPGVTTRPAQPGEIILLFGTGFGPTNPPVPTGLLGQAPQVLANPLTITIGGVNAPIDFGGIVGPGLYQFNVHVPNLPAGDAALGAQIGGVSTPSGVLLTIQP